MSKIKDFLRNDQLWSSITVINKRRNFLRFHYTWPNATSRHYGWMLLRKNPWSYPCLKKIFISLRIEDSTMYKIRLQLWTKKMKKSLTTFSQISWPIFSFIFQASSLEDSIIYEMKLVDNVIRSMRVGKVFRDNQDNINHMHFSGMYSLKIVRSTFIFVN